MTEGTRMKPLTVGQFRVEVGESGYPDLFVGDVRVENLLAVSVDLDGSGRAVWRIEVLHRVGTRMEERRYLR